MIMKNNMNICLMWCNVMFTKINVMFMIMMNIWIFNRNIHYQYNEYFFMIMINNWIFASMEGWSCTRQAEVEPLLPPHSPAIVFFNWLFIFFLNKFVPFLFHLFSWGLDNRDKCSPQQAPRPRLAVPSVSLTSALFWWRVV